MLPWAISIYRHVFIPILADSLDSDYCLGFGSELDGQTSFASLSLVLRGNSSLERNEFSLSHRARACPTAILFPESIGQKQRLGRAEPVPCSKSPAQEPLYSLTAAHG